MRPAELKATVKELETQMEGLLLQVVCAFKINDFQLQS